MLSSKGGLYIAYLIAYLPILAITILVCRRHGWGRSEGWVFLFLFVLMRLAGAIAGIVADLDPTNVGAIITAAVMNGAGTSTLLMAQIGILKRLNAGMRMGTLRIPQKAFDLAVLALVALLAIAIASGVFLFSSNPERQATGHTLSQASGGMAIGIFCLIVFGLSWTTTNITRSLRTDRALFYASWVAFPFLLVRVVYLSLTTFQTYPSVFNYLNGSVYATAFMSFVPELIVVIAFLSAGWVVPPGRLSTEVREEAYPLESHRKVDVRNAGERV